MPYCYSYPRLAVTVDILVLSRAGKILLIQRKKPPFKDQWALPGGFVDLDETLEQAAIRELHEETGLHFDTLKQFKVYDAINRDPRHRTISLVFYRIIDNNTDLHIEAGDDASSAAWLPIDELPELAFDHKIILSEFMDFITQNP